MSKFQMAILFPTSLQWFWLMNNLSTKILNALYVKVAGPLDVKEEEEDQPDLSSMFGGDMAGAGQNPFDMMGAMNAMNPTAMQNMAGAMSAIDVDAQNAVPNNSPR
jgi:hypothetical protein